MTTLRFSLSKFVLLVMITAFGLTGLAGGANAAMSIPAAYTNTAGTQVVVYVAGATTYPVLPATGVTGFSVTVSGSADAVTAATASGNAVTLTLAAAVTAGQTVTLSYTPGNVTDSAATPNSLPTVSGVAGTNHAGMTLTTFPGNAGQWAGRVFSGPLNYYVSFGNRATVNPTQIDTVITGATCLLQFYTFGSPPSVSVDGGAFAPIPCAVANNWAYCPVFTGLSDAPHTLSITNGYIDATSPMQAFGATPALAVPSALAGQQAVLINPTTDLAGRFGIKGLIGVDGDEATSNGNQYFCNNGGSLRFRAACTQLRVYTFLNGSSMHLSVDDGPETSTGILPNTSAYAWVTLSSTLDGTRTHTYQIAGSFAVDLLCSGGAGFDLSTGLLPYPAFTMYGDSITTGAILDSGYIWGRQVSRLLKAGARIRGASGTSVYAGNNPSQSGMSRTSDITGMSPPPARCFVLYGRNDGETIGDISTSGTFAWGYFQMMNSLLSGTTYTRFSCMAVLPAVGEAIAGGQSVMVAAKNAAIRSVVAALQNPRVTFVDTAPWLMTGPVGTDSTYFGGPTAGLSTDPLHPNLYGNVYIATQLANSFTPPTRSRSQGGARLISRSGQNQ